jgi:hypothetical protein
MKRTTALAFLTAALISMGSACAHAQAAGFKVPFDFAVGDQVFPAGTYQVSYYATKTAILIRSQDERFNALTTTYPADPSTGGGMVVFRKYGNQYFLREVLCSALSMNVEIPKSRREKQGSHPGSATFTYRNCRGSPYRSEVMSIGPGRPGEIESSGHLFFGGQSKTLARLRHLSRFHQRADLEGPLRSWCLSGGIETADNCSEVSLFQMATSGQTTFPGQGNLETRIGDLPLVGNRCHGDRGSFKQSRCFRRFGEHC